MTDQEKLHSYLITEDPKVWLFYGDSITHGALHTSGWRDYVQHFEERLRWELGRKMDVVIRTAISGNRTTHLLETFDWRVRRFEPDIVFIMVGINDSNNQVVPPENFRANMITLIEQCRQMGSIVVLQTPNPILPNTRPEFEANLPIYIKTIREVAQLKEVVLIDHEKYWQGNDESFYYWMSDGAHPNEYGHRVFAQLLFKELGIYDDDSRTCRLYIP